MKNLVTALAFIFWLCIGMALGFGISEGYTPEPTYQIRREPTIMLNRWQVTKQDSVCYTGSIADCQAWIETEDYRKN